MARRCMITAIRLVGASFMPRTIPLSDMIFQREGTMMKKVIPLRSQSAPRPAAAAFAGGALADTLGRPMRDLRISVTDRCNFRCVYCMPREGFDSGYKFLPHDAILTFEEIARLAGIFVGLVVEKILFIGCVPLVPRDVPRLIALLPFLND